MIFKKCDESDIRNNQQAFSDLFISVYHVNFPDGEFTNNFGYERVQDILGYIEDKSAIVYGAFEDDRLAGFIWGYTRRISEEIRIHVPVLVVNKQHQRKGVARRLMEMMKSYCHDNSIFTIEVMVSSTNNDALEYYEKVGFKETRKLLELRTEHDD